MTLAALQGQTALAPPELLGGSSGFPGSRANVPGATPAELDGSSLGCTGHDGRQVASPQERGLGCPGRDAGSPWSPAQGAPLPLNRNHAFPLGAAAVLWSGAHSTVCFFVFTPLTTHRRVPQRAAGSTREHATEAHISRFLLRRNNTQPMPGKLACCSRGSRGIHVGWADAAEGRRRRHLRAALQTPEPAPRVHFPGHLQCTCVMSPVAVTCAPHRAAYSPAVSLPI